MPLEGHLCSHKHLAEESLLCGVELADGFLARLGDGSQDVGQQMPELAGPVVHHFEDRVHLHLGNLELRTLVRKGPAQDTHNHRTGYRLDTRTTVSLAYGLYVS